jgi:hypothetical protein
MKVLRSVAAGMTLGLATVAAVPASAQFYMQPKEMAGGRVSGEEADVAIPLPGATAAERRAGLVWTMRAALNVAALQCQFEPTLLTVDHYNGLLLDHNAELKGAFDTLAKYYVRTAKTAKAGQSALDQYGTRTYSAFATVAAQRNFCETAHRIGRDAIFTPRGRFGDLAEERMRELRNSLTPYGEQLFPRYMRLGSSWTPLPRLESVCWNKKGEWQTKKCGAQNWPPAGVGVASR